MAEKPQSFDERHARDLSVGTYATKKAIETGVTVGSIGGGGLAGYFAVRQWPKAFLKPVKAIAEKFGRNEAVSGVDALLKAAEEVSHSDSRIAEDAAKKLENIRWLGAGTGALIGAMAAGVALAYRHWLKEERMHIGIRDANNDLSMMNLDNSTPPELVAQYNTMHEMWQREHAKTQAMEHQLQLMGGGNGFAPADAAQYQAIHDDYTLKRMERQMDNAQEEMKPAGREIINTPQLRIDVASHEMNGRTSEREISPVVSVS